MPTIRDALAPALALVLAACNGGGGDNEQARSGEVLEGTISDAMLPIDTVRSQPPLAAPEPVEGTLGGSAAGESGAAADAATDAPAAEEGAEDEAAEPGSETRDPAGAENAEADD